MAFLKTLRFWIIFNSLIIIAAGAYLYTAGKLPFPAGNEAIAAADSTDTTAIEIADQTEEKDGDEEKKPLPILVELAKVEGRGISAYYRSASVIEADRLVDLVSRTQGRIRTINLEEGDWVEEGQILAELENDREQIQLRKAELALADKKRSLDRSQRMLDEALVSQQEYDDIESAWHLAGAERDLAKINLEDTRIRAPFAGRITDRKVVLGQQVAASAPAFTLGDFQPMRVRVHLPETIARKIESGQRVLVSPEAVENPLEAIVERISPVVDPTTSTVRLTLLLDDERAGARVGSFVKVRITTDTHVDALSIPKLALVEEGALRSVFVAEADTVRKVEIGTGLYDETHVEIVEGLFDGDYVVTMGQGGLRTGSQIDALNGQQVGYSEPDPDDVDPAATPETVTALAEKN